MSDPFGGISRGRDSRSCYNVYMNLTEDPMAWVDDDSQWEAWYRLNDLPIPGRHARAEDLGFRGTFIDPMDLGW